MFSFFSHSWFKNFWSRRSTSRMFMYLPGICGWRAEVGAPREFGTREEGSCSVDLDRELRARFGSCYFFADDGPLKTLASSITAWSWWSWAIDWIKDCFLTTDSTVDYFRLNISPLCLDNLLVDLIFLINSLFLTFYCIFSTMWIF